MVVPFGNGKLVRSMVRIPGSGYDSQAAPVSLDLSKVSSLAATVQVPQTLPRAFSRSGLVLSSTSMNRFAPQQTQTSSHVAAKKLNNEPMQSPWKEATAEVKSEPTGERKRPLSENDEENGSSTPPAPKKARTDNTNAQPQLQFQIPSVTMPNANQPMQVFLLQVSSGAVTQATLQQSISAGRLSLQQAQLTPCAMPVVLAHQNQLVANLVFGNQLVVPHGIVQIGNMQNAKLQAVSFPKTLQVQHKGRESSGASSASTVPQNQAIATEELLQEMKRLKEENKALVQNVTKYQNVFKSRENLQHIAKRLAEMA